MTKKTIALLMIFTLIFGATTTLSAQDHSSYKMWENIMLTPDNTKLKALGEAMSKHNKAYHQEGPHKATVYNIVSGPNVGNIIWEMGPLKFSDLDVRPSKGGHDEDWRDNVMPNIKKMTHGEYWIEDKELSNTSMLDSDKVTHPILLIRYFEAAKGHDYSIDHLLKQMSETVKAMDGDNPWGVYDNEFRQGYTIGRHLSWVSFNKNWAEMDEEPKFKETFIKVHGEDSWLPFIEGMADSFSNSWDEIWEYNAKMSGK